jgi:serine protease Do
MTASFFRQTMSRSQSAVILFLCVSFCGLLRAQDPPSGIETAAAIEKVLVDVIARCEKSVVAIARVRKQQPGETFQMEFRPDPFGRKPTPLAPPQPTDPDFIPNEYGTGVVVDQRGLVLTTCDLLGEDNDYYVTTAERKVYKATVKGADPRSNLAVLAIDAVELMPISFGNAEEVKKGQIVISLGNPYAIARDGQPSAAWGIVANLARKAPAMPSQSDPSGRPTLHHYGTLIQTDAKLNLGTSGGPLLNLHGKMVGLAVAWAATPGYEAAGGYAIPVDQTFRRAVDTLKLGREVEYGFLGIQPTNLRQQEILAGMQGMRVGQVYSGTPAARHGLKPGDVITAVDETPIHDADGLVLNVGKLPAEAVTHLTVLRGGSPRTVEVSLAKYAVQGRKIVTASDPAWRGLRVDYPTAVVDEAGRPRGGTSFPDNAVMVLEVSEGSPAHAAGLRPGTLITHVDGAPARTPKDFAAAVARNRGPVQLRLAGSEKAAVCTVRPGN